MRYEGGKETMSKKLHTYSCVDHSPTAVGKGRRGRRGGEGGKRRGGEGEERRGGEGEERRGRNYKIPSRYPYQSFKDEVTDSVCILCHDVKQSIECVG